MFVICPAGSGSAAERRLRALVERGAAAPQDPRRALPTHRKRNHVLPCHFYDEGNYCALLISRNHGLALVTRRTDGSFIQKCTGMAGRGQIRRVLRSKHLTHFNFNQCTYLKSTCTHLYLNAITTKRLKSTCTHLYLNAITTKRV